jgi:hypothetical protein
VWSKGLVIAGTKRVWYEQTMAMDPLEKERWRRQLATRMHVILEGAKSVQCVSAHYYETPVFCELCQQKHAEELVVIRNRPGKNFHVAVTCLLEMVRFQVVDAVDLGKWTQKMKLLRLEHEKRKQEEGKLREEERKRVEKKVIVRKRDGSAN